MSPSLPPVGADVETYLVPYPLELAAIVKVTLAVNAPPPDSPEPAITFVALAAAPRLVLASAAVLAPVPPSATVKSVMPVIVPPVMFTLLAPRLVSPIAEPPVMFTAPAL